MNHGLAVSLAAIAARVIFRNATSKKGNVKKNVAEAVRCR